jgi:hypothetical protein
LIGNRTGKGAKRKLRALFGGGAALLFLAAAAPADTHPDPLTEPHQHVLLDAFLAGTPDAADLGNGGGVLAQTLAMLGGRIWCYVCRSLAGIGVRTAVRCRKTAKPSIRSPISRQRPRAPASP